MTDKPLGKCSFPPMLGGADATVLVLDRDNPLCRRLCGAVDDAFDKHFGDVAAVLEFDHSPMAVPRDSTVFHVCMRIVSQRADGKHQHYAIVFGQDLAPNVKAAEYSARDLDKAFGDFRRNWGAQHGPNQNA